MSPVETDMLLLEVAMVTLALLWALVEEGEEEALWHVRPALPSQLGSVP